MSLSAIYRMSFALAAIDMVVATICAAAGDVRFVAFIVLAGLMWAHGSYYKAKAVEENVE
jgi:ABC-type polysaccharide/polyol phosphate export permease